MASSRLKGIPWPYLEVAIVLTAVSSYLSGPTSGGADAVKTLPQRLQRRRSSSYSCQGTPTFPHLGDTYSPAGHWSSWRPQARGETLFSISFIRKLRPSIWMTWQWCSKRSRIAVARTSSPASMSGQSRIPLLEVITVLPRS